MDRREFTPRERALELTRSAVLATRLNPSEVAGERLRHVGKQQGNEVPQLVRYLLEGGPCSPSTSDTIRVRDYFV